MADRFDLTIWKKQVADWWREAACDVPGTMKRLGVRTAYGLLAASAWLPLLAAYANDPGQAMAAMEGVLAAVGTNLAANLMQGAYDRSKRPAEVEQELGDDAQLQTEFGRIFASVEALSAAHEALGQKWSNWDARLRAELEDLGWGLHIETGGGAYVGGNVNTQGGDFVGRDRTSSADRGSVVVDGDAQSVTVINAQTIVVAAERYWRGQPQGRDRAGLRQATEEYLHCILDRHLYLSLKGMGVSDRVALRLPLLDLYVPLKAHPQMPDRETWPRELRLAGRDLGNQEMQAVAGTPGEPQAVLDLVRQYDGLIILGDPGAGKTTFLKYLALKLALGEGESLRLGDRLPVLLPLSAYANALAQRDVRLDEFIADHCHNLGANLPIAELVASALQSGRALILLDGLDEVNDPNLRHTVVERVVDFFVYHRRAGNKFVLTSRIVGYREVRPTAEGLGECTLTDFQTDDIRDFVHLWTAALEKQVQGDTGVSTDQAQRECDELLAAVEANPGVQRLAANPLLLTILALMKRQGVTLPERRVELYDQYVRVLLSIWNRARGLGRAPTRDLDPLETMRTLAPLALWMHEVSPGVGLVKREALRRQLEAIFADRGHSDPTLAARRFLEDVHEYAGLLLERGPGEYGFIHLTFEEYLAGVAVAQKGQRDLQPVVEALMQHVGDAAWQEVSLLAIAYLSTIQQRDEAAGAVVEALAEQVTGSPGAAIVLAGEATADIYPGGVPTASRDRVVEKLIGTMQSTTVTGSLRRRAGLALGRLGWLPDDLDEFVYIPPGRFLYGDKRRERMIADGYWIGKYPVTNAQYNRFTSEGGYEKSEFWSQEGWRYNQENSQRIGRRGLSSEWANPFFPVIGVTAYEAEAYASWLHTRLASLGHGPDLDEAIARGYKVRLPTEEQWERAARGKDGRKYPWEGPFEGAFSNTREGHADGTTAVCTYPSGASLAGAWDMSGNIWEWTMSQYATRDKAWVVRGGSWLLNRWYARCAYRYYVGPGYRDVGIGFRVVVSPGSRG